MLLCGQRGEDIFRPLVRSFFLQSSWNLERLQNLGFLYALMPALEKLYSQEDKRKAAQIRHLELFNSQPYMASSILGAVVNLERECADGKIKPENISVFKKNTMSGFAVLGDTLFWSTLRPLCASLALLFAYEGKIWAPLIFFVIYNFFHFFIRVWGYLVGLQYGIGVIEKIASLRIPSSAQVLRRIMPLIIGGVLYVAASSTIGNLAGEPILVALPIALVCWILFKKGCSPIIAILGIFLVALCISLATGLELRVLNEPVDSNFSYFK